MWLYRHHEILNQDFYLQFGRNSTGNTWNSFYSNFYGSCCALWIRGVAAYWLNLSCKHFDLCCGSFKSYIVEIFSKFHFSVFSLLIGNTSYSKYICKGSWVSKASQHTWLSLESIVVTSGIFRIGSPTHLRQAYYHTPFPNQCLYVFVFVFACLSVFLLIFTALPSSWGSV